MGLGLALLLREGQGDAGPADATSTGGRACVLLPDMREGMGWIPGFCCSHSSRQTDLLLLAYVKPVFGPSLVLLLVYWAHRYLADVGYGVS